MARDFNQALMDLGSDIESPVNPRPEESPVRDFSAAYQNGTMDRYPIKEPKKKPLQSISRLWLYATTMVNIYLKK